MEDNCEHEKNKIMNETLCDEECEQETSEELNHSFQSFISNN